MSGMIIALAAGIVSALLLILSMPGTGIWPLALVAFVPILVHRVRYNVKLGWVGSLVFALVVSVYFGRWYFTLFGGGFGAILFSLFAIIGFALLYYIVLELAVWVSWRRPVLMPFALPVLWTAFDLFRTMTPGVNLAWFPVIANSQADNLGILQSLSVGGVELVTFLILLVNASLAYVLVKPIKIPRYIWAAFILLGPLFLSISGIITVNRLNQSEETDNIPEVVLIQGWPDKGEGAESFIRADLDEFGEPGAIVVFPEIFMGDFSDPDFREGCRSAAEDFGVYLVVQGPETISGCSYNAAVLFGPDGKALLKYRKQYIPPGDPTIPGRGLDERNGFDDAGLLICYDTHFASAPQEQARDGVRFFLVPSNNVGYGDEFFYRIHFNNHIFRAVENRAYIYVSGADGITGAISPTGKVLGTLPIGVRGEALVIGEQPIIGDVTFYSRFPWVFPVALAGGLLFILVAAAISHRSRWRTTREVEKGEIREEEALPDDTEKVIEAVTPDNPVSGGNGSNGQRQS